MQSISSSMPKAVAKPLPPALSSEPFFRTSQAPPATPLTLHLQMYKAPSESILVPLTWFPTCKDAL